MERLLRGETEGQEAEGSRKGRPVIPVERKRLINMMVADANLNVCIANPFVPCHAQDIGTLYLTIKAADKVIRSIDRHIPTKTPK